MRDLHDDALARYRAHAELCKVLTDPKRLMLLDALCDTEHTVGELADALGISLPNASQHLAVMRGAGLVETRRVGTSVRYRIAEPTITDACAIVDSIVRRRLGQPPAARRSTQPGPAGTGAASDPTVTLVRS